MIVLQAIDLCDMLKNAINNINDEQYTKKEDLQILDGECSVHMYSKKETNYDC